ncbi:phaC PHA synthase [Psychromonas sp. RZ22]|uniref:VC2662 family protein n=1 Tax=Psychromonas algarum TaxID=2555643 RepID=UPI001067C3BF|nr:phaC PHA synthase [Psychromonas sp. RZ22]TEW56198.1 phaC PHA synthase [Psychromonas sp. RZ22]
MKKQLAAIAIATSLLSVSVQAADKTPIMFSSVNGFNAPNASEVTGVRLAALHGKVDKVTGLDIALLGMSETNTTVGVNYGIFGGHKVNKSMTGASLGIFNWSPGETLGANLGIVNVTGNVKGANVSAVNYSEGNTMVDVAFVSISKQSTVQVGIFNKTAKIDGVQVGLINCADNGFFKCFPIVNFAK